MGTSWVYSDRKPTKMINVQIDRMFVFLLLLVLVPIFFLVFWKFLLHLLYNNGMMVQQKERNKKRHTHTLNNIKQYQKQQNRRNLERHIEKNCTVRTESRKCIRCFVRPRSRREHHFTFRFEFTNIILFALVFPSPSAIMFLSFRFVSIWNSFNSIHSVLFFSFGCFFSAVGLVVRF